MPVFCPWRAAEHRVPGNSQGPVESSNRISAPVRNLLLSAAPVVRADRRRWGTGGYRATVRHPQKPVARVHLDADKR